MKPLVQLISFILFIAGLSTAALADDEPERPAYLIISINEISPEKLSSYKKAVGPIAKKYGGVELLGFAQEDGIEVLEGEWNLPGVLVIERFESMEQLKRFWYSAEYQEVRKLREGHAEPNFFVAIEGRPLTR